MRIIQIDSRDDRNEWSSYRKKLIVMKLDIGQLEDYPTHKIPGFAERLEQLLPSMYEHECSENKPGGFFERVREGTWMGHVVEHIALELQSLAGMDCGYGRTRSAGKRGVYHVVFCYEEQQAGMYAAHSAIALATALIDNKPYDLDTAISDLVRIKERKRVRQTAS